MPWEGATLRSAAPINSRTGTDTASMYATGDAAWRVANVIGVTNGGFGYDRGGFVFDMEDENTG